MRIQILGTAAAEAWPAIFCGCETCRRARAAGGKDFRSRASLQIDDLYKIDLPPDTYYHIIRYGLDLSKLKYLFVTHAHGDHFALDELTYVQPGFAANQTNLPLKVYGNPTVLGLIQSRVDLVPDYPVALVKAEPFVPIEADHLVFTPVIAEHAREDQHQSLNYIIQSDIATVLYTCDTGNYGEETLRHLTQYRFDLLIVECTHGNRDWASYAHMNINGVVQLRDYLSKAEALAPNATTIITHFSHFSGLLHAELEEAANPLGIEVAYDGLVVEA